MQIHLLRHGIAIDRDDPACPTDPDRFLTERGKSKTELAMRGWATTGVQIDLVCVSPYVRAQQTADIAVAALGLADAERIDVEPLVPMGEPAAVASALKAFDAESVLCVGHAPNLDLVIAYLTGSEAPVTSMKKAGVASLEAYRMGRGTARLVGFYPPAVLRRLAEDPAV